MQKNDIIPAARDLFDGIPVFLSVARHKSFRLAAEELGLSPSAVGQTIRHLETRLGVALLARTTRRVGLTEAGEQYLPHALEAAKHLQHAEQQLQYLGNHAGGTLRLTMPSILAHLVAPLIIGEFCAQYPDISIEIQGDNRLIDLVEEHFDAAIRMGELIAKDMVAVRISPPFAFTIVASPAYLDRHGTPEKPEDLAAHRTIGYRLNENKLYRWEFVHGKRRQSLAFHHAIIVNDSQLAHIAAENSGGLAYLARPLVQNAIENGRLVSVLEPYLPQSDGIFLCYADRKQALPKLRAFIDFARERFATLI